MAESDECEFSLDLEDCLEENMPMLCLEIPQTYAEFIIKGSNFELNTFAVVLTTVGLPESFCKRFEH